MTTHSVSIGTRLRRFSAILALACAVLLPPPAAAAENSDRVALVIGNSDYGHLPSLINPLNDARGMAAALWEAGFETIELIDANREQMLAGIAAFSRRLNEGTDAVFYYAGHGVQSQGANFLLPVDTKIEHAAELATQGIDANEIAVLMSGGSARINVVILDACRDNPFVGMSSQLALELSRLDEQLVQAPANTQVVVRSTQGLAPMQATRAETIVGYSTGPGEVALDGETMNSPYTAALLEHINTPGLEIDLMFRRVRAMVRELTDGMQVPWVASTLENEFYIRPIEEANAVSLEEALADRSEDTRQLGMAPPQQLLEEAVWRVAETSGSLDSYTTYLERYPEGAFAAEAGERVAMLELDPSATPEPSAADPERTIEAYLGVGPIPLDLATRVDATRSAFAFEVTATPTAGTVFRRDETPIRSGHLLAADELDGLSFLPRVGTRSVGITEYLEIVPRTGEEAGPPIRVGVSSALHPCDLLAGFRYAPDRVWDGVELPILQLDPEPAIEACEQATVRFPEVDRFVAILSRAYQAGGNYEAARLMAIEAIERNYPPGFGQLGTLYMKALGVTADYPRALDLFRQGVELGNPASALRIGEMYEAGWGVPQDYGQAMAWFARSAEMGNAYATTRMARLHLNGLGVATDPRRAVELFQEAAEVGELSAQVTLSRLYRTGDVIPQNLDEALRWARAAAGTGMPSGQMNLGRYYEGLPEGQRDLEAAVFWLSEAERSGDPWAPVYLGNIHLDAAFSEGDADRARDYFMLAVERGNRDAARRLGQLYASEAVGDPTTALRWHRVAAEAGNVWSMRDYARALMRGEGVEPDPGAGFSWLVRSADGGNPYAQRDVGRAYLDGDAVQRDTIEAVRYLGLAAGSSDAGAAESAVSVLEAVDARERVRAVQTFLGELGFDAGPPDGMAGPATRSALATASTASGLPLGDPPAIETVAALAAATRSGVDGNAAAVDQGLPDRD